MSPCCGRVATATPPKRGHSYRVSMGTFSQSSDTAQLPVDMWPPLCQYRAMLGEAKNQFSLTRAASSTCGRAKSSFLSVTPDQNESARRSYWASQLDEAHAFMMRAM